LYFLNCSGLSSPSCHLPLPLQSTVSAEGISISLKSSNRGPGLVGFFFQALPTFTRLLFSFFPGLGVRRVRARFAFSESDIPSWSGALFCPTVPPPVNFVFTSFEAFLFPPAHEEFLGFFASNLFLALTHLFGSLFVPVVCRPPLGSLIRFKRTRAFLCPLVLTSFFKSQVARLLLQPSFLGGLLSFFSPPQVSPASKKAGDLFLKPFF